MKSSFSTATYARVLSHRDPTIASNVKGRPCLSVLCAHVCTNVFVRCVTKMDHHCPWINSCVGHANHASFVRFLFFVPFGCIHGVILNANFIYRLLDYVSFVCHFILVHMERECLYCSSGISFWEGEGLYQRGRGGRINAPPPPPP